MAISAAMVKELRERTDAPMMECKKALTETNGDMQAAIDWLRTRGVSKAAKKAGREMTEGRIEAYIHTNGKVGVLLELQCETDFCAKNDDFGSAMRDICMHIAAADPAPMAVSPDDIPADELAREKAIYEEQAAQSGKPKEFWPKIVEGRVSKFVKSVALLEQPFVKNPDITVGTLLTDLVGKLGENISCKRFVKYRVGE